MSGYDLAVPGSMEGRDKNSGVYVPIDAETFHAATVHSVVRELIQRVDKLQVAVEELQKQNIDLSRQLRSLEARTVTRY